MAIYHRNDKIYRYVVTVIHTPSGTSAEVDCAKVVNNGSIIIDINNAVAMEFRTWFHVNMLSPVQVYSCHLDLAYEEFLRGWFLTHRGFIIGEDTDGLLKAYPALTDPDGFRRIVCQSQQSVYALSKWIATICNVDQVEMTGNDYLFTSHSSYEGLDAMLSNILVPIHDFTFIVKEAPNDPIVKISDYWKVS